MLYTRFHDYSRKQLLLILFLVITLPLLLIVLGQRTGWFSSATSQTPPSTSFQPTAPYYAAFFYPWFKNAAIDGSWNGSTWSDPDTLGSHSPPTNWFSNYLPDPNPSQFSPSSELYSSDDYTTFKWQLTKLAEAKQEVAISSWWAQGHKTDITLGKIINDFMTRSDNPYPNLRWALYYECEGNAGGVCDVTGNPSTSQIASDLNYLKTNYAASPYLLKVSGKPVMFVYADATDGGSSNTNCSDTTDTSMTHRWYQANSQVGNAFYIVLKVFPGFATTPCQPSEWHQYAPAVRSDSQGSHSFAISPGFWRSGDPVRLTRDLSAFQTAATSMVNSSATWRLTTTWNEWGEGTAVEPGTEVIQANGSTATVQNPNGTAFGNAYVDILKNTLPSLEAGTGTTNQTPTETISPSVAPTTLPTPTLIKSPTPIPTNSLAPTSIIKKGDFNNDGSVDLLDFNLWRDEFSGIAISKKSDQNNDGVVDLLDFAVWLNAFQAGT